MSPLTAYSILKELKIPAFRTSDVAASLSVERKYASELLRRLAKEDLVIPLKKGLWSLKETDPMEWVPLLHAPALSAVSLQTALFYHGLIEQIPAVIYAVTTGPTRKFTTGKQSFSFHHLQPKFYFGYEPVPRAGFLMASPEKALIDFLYLSGGKSTLFKRLPELEIPRAFRRRLAWDCIERIPSPRLQELVATKFERLLKNQP